MGRHKQTFEEKVFNILFNDYYFFKNIWIWYLQCIDICKENNITELKLTDDICTNKESAEVVYDILHRVHIKLTKGNGDCCSFGLVNSLRYNENTLEGYITISDLKMWDFDYTGWKIKVYMDLGYQPTIYLKDGENPLDYIFSHICDKKGSNKIIYKRNKK